MSAPPAILNLLRASLLLCFLLPPFASLRAEWIPGVAEAVLDVTVRAPSGGQVASIHAREGDFIPKGETILVLDKRLEELELEKCRQTVELRKRQLEAAKGAGERESLPLAELWLAQAEYDLARERFKRRTVTAPFGGTLAGLLVKPGDGCEPRQPLARLVDTRQCHFIAFIDASTANRFKPGDTVEIEFAPDGQSTRFPASISFISPFVDSGSGLVQLKALFDNAEGKVRPGATGRINLPEKKDA